MARTPPPYGMRTTSGTCSAPACATGARGVVFELVEGLEGEAVELRSPATGLKPVIAMPIAVPDDRGLGKRRIDHALLAELLEESLGDPEDALVDADVLPSTTTSSSWSISSGAPG